MYDTILPIGSIIAHRPTAATRKPRHLRAYFAFDEGAGNQLNNGGSKLTGAGKSYGTEWAAFSAIQKTEPHVFAPKTRQVTPTPA
ncbi:MAG: hypothetical protein IPM98_15860 [Lewinellaceae bacterium]|nr:hypothetical protein [Lewinellaceae bacterium]